MSDRYAAALKEKALRDIEAKVRETLAYHDAMMAVANDICEQQIDTGTGTYVVCDGVALDDDANHPTIMMFAAEKWQGNQEDHVLVMPLEEFAERMAEYEVDG